MNTARLSTTDAGFDAQLEALLQWDISSEGGVEQVVRDILDTVRRDGDTALLAYTAEFDGLTAGQMSELCLHADDLQAASARVSDTDRDALKQAAERIRTFHEHQLDKSWSYIDDLGNELGQKIAPLEKVGVYVPGGQASYPSSVLMTLIPARVAGVEELIVTVPTPDGARNDMVLAALAIAGVDQVFTIGGAQAIGAMAFGTATVPKVDKIVGPGNAYVAAAKRQVFGHVGIDNIAGPSEVLVIADGSTDPEWIALDLFSQAEHDAAAQCILLCPDADYVASVDAAMQRLLPGMQRRQIISASLANRGALIITRDLSEAVQLANRIAPEHVELHVADPQPLVDEIRHAGAIFIGAYTAEAFGDYVAGPSHVLPTYGTARFASPLGVYDFQKRSSVIRMSVEGAARLADIAVPLATSEGLEAHARAAAARASSLNNKS